jgi:tryptophan-rich sensory protein
MFFFMHSAISGLVIIIFLDIAVLTYIIVTWRISKLASLLMWPYLLWLGFASYLNLYIWLNN